jgi:hypothetical protein
MQEPLATPYTIKETLAKLDELNQIQPICCNKRCSYNKWLINTKCNSDLFLNKSEAQNKYVYFHNILRSITKINLNKSNIKLERKIEQYIEAIDSFITKECSYDFFDVVMKHFHEENTNMYNEFLEPSIRLGAYLIDKKLHHIVFLSKYLSEKQPSNNRQQMNKNIFLSLQGNYPETTALLFKITNGIKNNSNDYSSYLDNTECNSLAILQNFIIANIEKKELLTEIVLSIFLQKTYLQDADSIFKLISFLVEQDINLVDNCYNILSRIKYIKTIKNDTYILSKQNIQDKIRQLSCNCSINEITIELKKLSREYPVFFIPIIEKNYYELKLNINLSDAVNSDNICYINYIIQQTKELMKLKTRYTY